MDFPEILVPVLTLIMMTLVVEPTVFSHRYPRYGYVMGYVYFLAARGLVQLARAELATHGSLQEFYDSTYRILVFYSNEY